MTREQAQELLANVNGKIEMKRLEAVNLLFREIDELKMMEEDAQQYALKCRKELEALQQPKSCEGCKYQVHRVDDVQQNGNWMKYSVFYDCGHDNNCKRNTVDRYEPKDVR